MNDFFWLETYQKRWSHLLRTNQKPHAVIVEGGKGVGKQKLAERLSTTMLCSISNTEPCGNCSNCHLSLSGKHPDIFEVWPDKGMIKVDDIRQLIQFFVSTPHCSQHKIAHIMYADKMNKSAANALLKVLEEPPKRATLFLVTDSPQSLLPTILSRCLKMHLKVTPEHKKDVFDWLMKKSQAEVEEIEQLLYLSSYGPLYALDLINEKIIERIDVWFTDVLMVVTDKKSVSEVGRQWAAEEVSILLPHIQRIIMYQFCHIASAKQGMFGHHALFEYLNQQEIGLNLVYLLVNKLNSLIIELQTQLKKDLQYESFLVNFKQIILKEEE